MSTPMPRPAPVMSQIFLSGHDVQPSAAPAQGGSLVIQVLTVTSHAASAGSTLGGVDTPDEIREFLASRRARITPQQAGLPVFGGNRRVPGLRREEAPCSPA